MNALYDAGALADYLDAVPEKDRGDFAGSAGGLGIPHGHGGHHGGGGHWHGGGGRRWGGGWGGGPWWGGAYEVPVPYYIETQAQPERYIGVRPGETLRCAQQPIGDGLWRCHLGIIYDVTKYDLLPNGLARKGSVPLRGFGVVPAQVRTTSGTVRPAPWTPAGPGPEPIRLRAAPVTPGRYVAPGFTPAMPVRTTAPAPVEHDVTPTPVEPSYTTAPGPTMSPGPVLAPGGPTSTPYTGPVDPGGGAAAGGGTSSSRGWLWMLGGAALIWRALK